MSVPWDARFEELLRDVLPKLTELAGDTCLRSSGLDSLATIELLLRLEETYGVSVPDRLLTAETFGTPAALWAMIDGLRPGQLPADGRFGADPSAARPVPAESTAGGR